MTPRAAHAYAWLSVAHGLDVLSFRLEPLIRGTQA